MSKINFKEQKEKTNKKGIHFYVALGICVVAIGVAAYTTYDSIKRFAGRDEDIIASKTQQKYKAQNDNDMSYSETEKQVNYNKNSSNNLNEQQQHINSLPKNNTKAQDTVTTNTESSGVIVYPTSKNIIKKYSGDNPIFSKTLNDWRIHNGIDLQAEQGSKIKAITDGTVKEIYKDPLLGTTMMIEHNGGFTAYYSGLGETTLVNAGDSVESGQEIASINDVPCEAADGFHLHLAIKKDDKFIDPIEILGS